MANKNILIVEDEVLIAAQLQLSLERAGYHCIGIAVSYSQADEYLKRTDIHFVLLDVTIKGSKTGIDVATLLNRRGIPFMFLTSHTGVKTLTKLKEQRPVGYLSKPVNEVNVTTALDLHFQNTIDENRIPVKIGKMIYYFKLSEIVHVVSDHIYIIITTVSGEQTLRSTIKDFLMQFPQYGLLQINRSVLVNPERIKLQQGKQIVMDNGNEFRATKAVDL